MRVDGGGIRRVASHRMRRTSQPGMTALEVFGLWLLYAVAGAIVGIAALATATIDLNSDSSPTRFRTKVVAALSGAAIAVAIVGALLSRDPDVGDRDFVFSLVAGGGAIGGVLTLAAWVMIAVDLRRRAS